MESIWSKSCQIDPRPRLREDLRCEIAVIGAGMAGLLCADALRRDGHEVVVLEADRMASGQTRNTTAKITSQHGLIYSWLRSTLRSVGAAAYAAANEAAIREYRRMVEQDGIDCDFEESCTYVYGKHLQALRTEAAAAKSLGLPAEFLENLETPLPAAGAVRFSGQAQFHPLKFLRAVSQPLTVYEQTRVQAVDGTVLQTAQGTVRAEKVVFACHYPFLRLPGLYFTRLHQERSYVLALETAEPVDGMWIGSGVEKLSLRHYKNLLLLGGGGHRTGENSAGGKYAMLREKAKELFPDAREVAHWSAQDCVTPDGVPLIGQYSAGRPDWYVATGFGKWGMSSSMVAAQLLRRLIAGEQPLEATVFDPGRFRAGVLAGLSKEGGHAVKNLARTYFTVPKKTAEQLPPGHGGVVRLNGKKVGAYRAEDGTLDTVNVRCPHLGCQLAWNPDERSWDCPCHGSRFDFRGNLISGPAQSNVTQE